MKRCLQLAELGAGSVAPNPMVGAVLVYDDRVIGEGYHEKYGGPHAEVNCINAVPRQFQDLVKKSTLYVSLEPCTHFGKTPPCTDLIIAHGIPRVVIACTDSFEKVNGSGIQKLKDAGGEVMVGVMEKEALELNRRFFTFQKKQRPYIILKWAQSSNSKIANADYSAVAISNETTNRLVHKWRSEEAAIMVGTKTALHDDPSLTTRYYPGQSPVRVVIDKHLQLPTALKLFDGTVPTIILNTMKQEEDRNIQFYKMGENEDVLAVTLNILRQRNMLSLIVEGGAVLLQSFIDAGCWDEARVVTNTSLKIPNGLSTPVLSETAFHKQYFQDDILEFFRHAD